MKVRYEVITVELTMKLFFELWKYKKKTIKALKKDTICQSVVEYIKVLLFRNKIMLKNRKDCISLLLNLVIYW
jgi:hypothetical protein